jgi:hypothetical protein
MTVTITTSAVGAPTAILLDATEPAYTATTVDADFKAAATSSQTVTLTSPTGNLHVGDQVLVTMVDTPAIKASASVTIGGTVTAGNIVTVTVGGTAFSYTALSGDTTATIATALAALINADALYDATATLSVINITVTTAGAAGNATTLLATVAEGITALTIKTLGGLVSPAYVEVSKTIQLVARDQTGAVVSPTWTVTSGTSVTVGVGTGLVTATATTGPSVVTATSAGSVTAQFAVIVILAQTLTSLTVTPATANLAVSGPAQQFIAIASSATYSQLDYTTQAGWIDDLPVASVSFLTGLLTYSSAESGHVYAFAGSFTGVATVNIGSTGVYPATGAATSISSTGATLNGTTGISAPTASFFWYGPTVAGPFTTASTLPAGWTAVAASPAVTTASTPFAAAITGLTAGATYWFAAWNTVAGVNYPGSVLSFIATPAVPVSAVTLTTSNFITPYLTSKLSSYGSGPSDSSWILNNFSIMNPAPINVGINGVKLQYNKGNSAANMNYEVYKMGDVIYGKVNWGTGLGPTSWQKVLLCAWNGTNYVVVDSSTSVTTPLQTVVPFTMATSNVKQDGEYYLLIYKDVSHIFYPGDVVDLGTYLYSYIEEVYITYQITMMTQTLNLCPGHQTITGFITRASGIAPTEQVTVYLVYPTTGAVDVTTMPTQEGYFHLASRYVINPGSSGQFTLDLNIGASDIGKFYIFISDGYNGYHSPLGIDSNDAIVYYYLSNISLTQSMTLSAYISPVRIYKDQTGQPLLLHLVDQDGNPVTRLAPNTENVTGSFRWSYNSTLKVWYGYIDSDGDSILDTGEPIYWTINGLDINTPSLTEISAGFYRFEIGVGTSVDVRFRASYTFYGTPVNSNQVIINTIDKTVFNPYVDVTAPDAIYPYGDGTPWILDSIESVYDKLPCTIGNSFNIMVNSWDMPTAMLDDWYVYDASWEINGPVEQITGDFCGLSLGDTAKFLITQKGKISVTVNMTAWERVNKTDCPDWNPRLSETDMSQNACCHTYPKTFDICEVNSCTYGGVTLTGANITDSTTVEVGKKVDKFSVSVDPTGAPTDLVCSCPNYIVLMYMTNSDGSLLKNAFTVDTWSGTPYKGSMIWYNPQGATGPNISDQPIQAFKATGLYNESGAWVDGGLKFGDCPFNLYGITFNYPTGTSCGYSLVVKVIGLERCFDACGNMIVTYPMIAEDLYPITVTPSVTTLTATPTIAEGTVDPEQMLAGVPAIIDITNPGFSYDKGDTTNWKLVSWTYYFNGTKLNEYASCPTYVESGLTVSYSTTDTGYRFVLSRPFKTSGTFKIVGTSYYYDCTKKEVVTIEIEVLKPEFTVKIGLKDCDGTIIDNDGILTEGFDEIVYVTAVDPRGIHDFSTDPNWNLSVSAVLSDCDLPTSKVCGVVEGPGCEYGLPIRVVGYDNPNLADDPMVNLYFVSFGAKIKITSFKLVPPTVTVDPKEVPFTIPATATHVTFTVTDAHGHGASGVNVIILNTPVDGAPFGFGVDASGYSWSATAGATGCKGEVDWAFVPPYSGKYSIRATTSTLITCTLPCGWLGINTKATLEAVYQAPVVDTTKPVVEASAPAEVTAPMVTVSGKVTDNVGVASLWIGAMKVDFAPDGTFSAKVEVVEGANTIKVVAFDTAGNMGDKTLTVTYAVPKVTVVKVQIGSDIMTVNGKAVQIDAPAEIKNGRTFLPLRAISEALGAMVDWIAETQGITVTLGENTIGLQIGNTSAVVNGTVMTLDAAPYIKNSRTMVPFRVIAEGLGAIVEWDPALRIVTVTLAQ